MSHEADQSAEAKPARPGPAKTQPMALYNAPASGGPVSDLDEGPPSQPVDDIQQALVAAARQGAPADLPFEALPEPLPDLDEGPRPTPVDDIQQAILVAARQGVPTEVDFEALPEPGAAAPQKVIRFASKPVAPQSEKETREGSVESETSFGVEEQETEERESQADTAPLPAEISPLPPGNPLTGAGGLGIRVLPRADFWLLLALFVAFRLLTLFLLKPGGFIRDWSDFDTYRGIASLADYGLYPFLNFWLEWPPLVPWLMVGAYKLSLLLPPWPDDPRLWFIIILGAVFVALEAGNFWLVYRLAQRLGLSAGAVNRVLWLYAGLFPPVYAMLGFFDGVSLFFILLALDFLLTNRRVPSAISVGVGFMVKIIPVLVLPIALRRIWHQHRRNNREVGVEVGLYAVIVGLTIFLLLTPFLIGGSKWVLASARSITGRSAWETVWAVADGYYGFGKVEGIRLNPKETEFAIQPGQLPWWVWPLVNLVFGLLYAFLFTRPADYSRPRVFLAFSGLTIAIFLLYSKGYSPQFLVYLLPFIVLLFPDGRGLTYALILTGLNVLEQPVYFVLLPRAAWLLTFIVVVRFIVLTLLALEFALIIWLPPEKLPAFLVKAHRYMPAGLGGLAAVALLALTPLLLRAYTADRLAQSPAQPLVSFMQAQAQHAADPGYCPPDGPASLRLFLSDQDTYRELYPYLHHDINLRLVAGAPPDIPIPPVADTLPTTGAAWLWPTGSQATGLETETAKKGRIIDTFLFEGLGAVTLYHFPANVDIPTCPTLARFNGGIELLTYRVEKTSSAVNLTLFWRARSPQTQNLTVFTQLLNPGGQYAAGHDGQPRAGAAPTTGWAVNTVQADPHLIPLPPGLPLGDYTLVVGLYTDLRGRLSVFDAAGSSYPNQAVSLGTIKLP